MSTKNNPGAYDCYANAEPDEPMFVLLGRDRHAPALVWLWRALREIEGTEDQAKLDEANACSMDMIRWQADHGRKTTGVGVAALAGVMELIRAANHAVKNPPNDATGETTMRLFLSQVPFDNEVRQANFEGLVKDFEDCVRSDEMKGGGHHEDIPGIEADLAEARQALFAALKL